MPTSDAQDELRKWSTQIRKGSLELCLLGAIAGRPRYGFEIAQSLGGDGGLAVSEGTLYPLLNRLLAEGLIEASWRESASGPPRKYYALTPSGRQTFEAMRQEWRRYTASVESILASAGDETPADLGPVLGVEPKVGK